MEIKPLALDGVLLVTPPRIADERGYFSEVWNRRRFSEAGLDLSFVQDNESLSRRKGTIRGLHFQVPPSPQGKLVRVLRGAVRDVAVDIRTASPTYGQHVAVELTEKNGHQLWVPVGFAHGFCTLVDDTVIHYKVTGYYDRDCDKGIRFDDPDLAIDWGIDPADAVLSDKDRNLPILADFPSCFDVGAADGR